jgi:hypothetical protein
MAYTVVSNGDECEVMFKVGNPDEVEVMCKETAVTQFQVLPRHMT